MHKLQKKVLLISSWAPPMVGGPQNLFNLFSNIEADSYSILTSTLVRDSLQQSTTGSRLAGKYYFAETQFDKKSTPSRPDITHTQKTRATLLQSAAEIIRKIPFVGPMSLSIANLVFTIRAYQKTFKRASQESNFDVLLGISDTGTALLATHFIAKIYHLPSALYYFDLYRGNLLPQPYKLLARILEPRLVQQAQIVIVTNEKTAAYYKRRYGTKINLAVVRNSAFPEAFEKTRTSYTPTQPYSIVFTGNIYWAQEQAVLNLIQAMHLLTDLPIQLKLYCPKPPQTILQAVQEKANIWLGAAPQAEMPAVQSAATLLFLPLAWDTKAPDIIATATPGKFTDYLASGRPMLVHAPAYAYVSTYTRQHNLGLVVDENSPEKLAEAIRVFLSNPDKGRTYIENALRVFHQNHDARKNAIKLTEMLNLI